MTSEETPTVVSRRAFARRIAVATAAAATALAMPEGIRGQSTATAPGSVTPQSGVPPGVPKEVAEEVEAKFNEVLRLNGPRFTPQQQEELRRQLLYTTRGLQRLRAYALDNADAPATVLRLRATEAK